MQTLNYTDLSKRKADIAAELFARSRMLAMETARRDSLSAMVETNRRDIVDFQAAVHLCRVCIQEQSSAKEHFERIISSLLNGVMQGVHDYYDLAGDTPVYEYRLEPVEDAVGALTGLKPTVVKNGMADDPKNFGGGVQNLIKFAGDLLHVLLSPDELAQVAVWDEPMTNLSPKAWKFVVRFLEDLQKDLDLQVVTITHSGAQFPVTWYVWREGQSSYVRQMAEEQI